MLHRTTHHRRTDFLSAMVLLVGFALLVTVAFQANLLA